MIRDDVIRMARESGIWQGDRGEFVSNSEEQLEDFAALVAAAEREACAKLCEAASATISEEYVIGREARDAGLNCCANLATAIRARSHLWAL